VGAPALRRGAHYSMRVLKVDGPHRLASEWWATSFDRSYYWLSLEDGALWWIFRDEHDGRMYLHAVAD
jgi:protein ImuB